jgi:hypothetical protein
MTKEDAALRKFVKNFNREHADVVGKLTFEDAKRLFTVTFDENGEARFRIDDDLLETRRPRRWRSSSPQVRTTQPQAPLTPALHPSRRGSSRASLVQSSAGSNAVATRTWDGSAGCPRNAASRRQ